jgi:hypothetical protein
VTPDEVQRDLREEIRKLGGEDLILSTNVPVRRDGGMHVGAREPMDSGVAVYFTFAGEPRAMACDRYDRVWKNVRALSLCIEALRALERHGSSEILNRAFRGFAALPSGESSWWEVLGLSSAATNGEVEAAYRRLAVLQHPDKGGTDDGMRRLNAAVETARARA